MKRISATRPKTGGDQNTQGGEALIDFLESKLEQIEMNFQKSQTDYEELQ
jgi:hypothetical protein